MHTETAGRIRLGRIVHVMLEEDGSSEQEREREREREREALRRKKHVVRSWVSSWCLRKVTLQHVG
jgi:hypothetical protein